MKDLREHGEEGLLKAAHGAWVGLAGDPDGQAQGLKQVVVEVGLAGILKAGEKSNKHLASWYRKSTLLVDRHEESVWITLLTKSSFCVS